MTKTIQRVRFYKTAKAIIPIYPDPDVLARYMASGDRAFGLNQRRSRKGGAGKPSGLGKQRLRKPPVGGWLGGPPDRNGIKATETYPDGRAMRASECCNYSKVF